MNAKLLRRLLLGPLLLCLALGGAVAYAAATSKPKPDFTLSLGSSTSNVAPGQTAQYTVTITRSGGFTGSVSLTATGAPSGSTTTITPSVASATTSQVSVTVATATTTNPGTYDLTIKGTSGVLSHTLTAPLTIAAATPSSFTLTVTNDNVNTTQGEIGVFAISISRRNLTASISFSVTGTPPGATATFTPASTTGNSTTLQVATSPTTPLGSYTVTVKGTAGSITSTVPAHFSVSAAKQGKNFTIGGDVTQPLAPGVTAPINLSLSNPNNQTLQVSSLAVTVRATSRSSCGVDNFSVRQFTGTYPIAVPANSTRTLAQLGVQTSKMPALTFIDKPVNQDACKNVTLTLGYAGTGSGS